MSDPFFNSAEGDGSNPDHLMTEDFETQDLNGGYWYGLNCDDANAATGIALETKGWCGDINNVPNANGAAQLGVGVNSSNCGEHTQANSTGTSADHSLFEAVDEIHVRWYQKWLSYTFGAEKVLTFNAGGAGVGGIKWGNIHINCGIGTPSAGSGNLQWQPVGGGFGSCIDIMTITDDTWWCIEIHALLSTTTTSDDGFLKVYCDDCGSNGITPPGSQTLRLDQTNMSWDRLNSGELFGSLWFEAWANPGSTGVSYIDNIVASKAAVGFIGAPAGGGSPPIAAYRNANQQVL